VFKRLISITLLVAGITGLAVFLGKVPETNKPDLDTPSPALGKAVATSLHAAMTDPYFAPLEKLADWMQSHSENDRVTVDMLSKWAPDDEIPTCFVWETDGSRLQLDHPADPAALDLLLQRLKEGMGKPNPTQLLYISSFRAEGEKYWLGFVAIPAGSSNPTQMAGVFFSMGEYLRKSVPRLMFESTTRPRFPLVNYQMNSAPIHGEREGDISVRILDKNGEVFCQQGRTFNPEQMIYAESQFYPKPIVAMQEGWDLQVFSSKAGAVEQSRQSPLVKWGAAGGVCLLAIILILWV